MQNLVDKSEEEIVRDARDIIEKYNPSIMYLKNNGDKNHKWDVDDLDNWIED